MEPDVFGNHQVCTFPTFDDGFIYFPQPPKNLYADGAVLAPPKNERTRVMTVDELVAFIRANAESS